MSPINILYPATASTSQYILQNNAASHQKQFDNMDPGGRYRTVHIVMAM
jgi:hypothetical protein